MKIISAKNSALSDTDLCEIKKVIQNDGIVVFPTETVYGIGANARSAVAVEKIFAAKGRPSDNPLIVHISSLDMLAGLVKTVGEIEQKLIDAFWSGPLTIVFEKAEEVLGVVSGGLETVAVRMPSNAVALQIISACSLPIVAPSANKSGKPSGTTVNDIISELPSVDLFVDGGAVEIGLESTVVKVINGVTTILRPGKITVDDLKRVVGKVEVSAAVLKELKATDVAESPGMKYRHYAPNCKCFLVETEDKSKTICDFLRSHSNEMTVVIGVEENEDDYKGYSQAKFLSMGKSGDYDKMAKNIFSLLREAERLEPSQILIESVKTEGIGLALYNRLIRSCGHSVIR